MNARTAISIMKHTGARIKAGRHSGGNSMKNRLTAKLLLAGMAMAPIASVPMTAANAQSVVRPSQEIVISIGKGELINLPARWPMCLSPMTASQTCR